MAGNFDRVHGYNPVYRNPNPQSNFNSFEWENHRPTAFIFKVVSGAYGNPVLDHQGHIVPQNILNIVLNPLQKQMAEDCNNLNDVGNFIQANQGIYPWLASVFQYGNAINAPMFDFDSGDDEDRVGGFFSIVTWNPVIICRAPQDIHRAGIPGNNLDFEVINYFNRPQNINLMNSAVLNSFNQLVLLQNNNNINQVISACCGTLNGQLAGGNGYYSFAWRVNALVPL